MTINREFRIRQVGDNHMVDRGTGAGWETYNSEDPDSYYDLDPQFYQCLVGEHDFEVHLWADGMLITAEFEEA